MSEIEQFKSTVAPEPANGNFRNCLRVGNQIFMSGMIAADPGADAYNQSLSCLEKVKALVEAAGGKMTDVIKITVFLTNIEDRDAFSRARSEFFPGAKPCSTLVGISALAQPGLVVEVEATAIIGAGD